MIDKSARKTMVAMLMKLGEITLPTKAVKILPCLHDSSSH